MIPYGHQALLGRKGPESLRGVLKVWGGDREELGSDRQVVLQGPASYVRDKAGPVERMVGKHRVWRRSWGTALTWCQLPPPGACTSVLVCR